MASVNWAIIGSDNGLAPSHYLNQWRLIVNCHPQEQISTKINTFSARKMHLKMLSAKWPPECDNSTLAPSQHGCRVDSHGSDIYVMIHTTTLLFPTKGHVCHDWCPGLHQLIVIFLIFISDIHNQIAQNAHTKWCYCPLNWCPTSHEERFLSWQSCSTYLYPRPTTPSRASPWKACQICSMFALGLQKWNITQRKKQLLTQTVKRKNCHSVWLVNSLTLTWYDC